jgi:hypothetical protein
MNCWRIQNLVAAFLDGVLCREEEQVISEHLEVCSECQTLVEGIAGLPDLPYSTLDEHLEEAVFEGFEEALSERIRHSVMDGVGAYGHEESLGSDENLSPDNRPALGILLGAKLSPALAVGYVAAMVLLAGGVAWNYLQVEKLEESVTQRDEIIDALQRRLVTLDLERDTGFSFTESGLSAAGPVFMPAAAPQALPPATISGFPSRLGSQPSPYQQVSLDGLRVIR